VDISLLKRLCEAPGIPGREEAIRKVTAAELAKVVDEVRVDALGNVVGTKCGNGGPRVMLAAHMDEIGFFVKHIDDNGFIRLQPIGGWDVRNLVSQRVMVYPEAGDPVRGALQLSAKPIHLLSPDEIKPPKMDELFVDVGFPAEEVKQRVRVGDMVNMDRTLEETATMVVSKSLDDRVAIFVMIEAIRAMNESDAEIIAVATTQEEVGLRGARTAAFDIQPDLAIGLDVTLAVDIPGAPQENAVTRIGKGAAIKVSDSSHIVNVKFMRHLRDIAEQHSIPYQMEVLPFGGQDGGAMQQARGGAYAATISIPTRYIHTPNEMASKADIDACVTLLARYLEVAGSRDYGFAEDLTPIA
jgi:putative aminopeptidase FrvX